MSFQSLARTALKSELTTLLSRPRSIVEHGDDVPDLRLATGAQAVSWLTSLKYPDLERWVFFGRRLLYEAPDDREVLGDIRQIAQFVAEEFQAWHGVWAKIWAAA